MSENKLFLLSNLNDSQQKRIDDAGISYYRETLTRHRGSISEKLTTAILGARLPKVEGLVLDQDAYSEALAVLGAVQMSVETLTDPKIYLPALRFSEKMRPIVTVAAWRPGGYPSYAPYVRIVQDTLLPAIRRDIAIHAPGTGEPVAASSTGRLQLNIWSSSGLKQQRRPANQQYIFGQPITPGSTAFRWSGRGTKIVDEFATAVGELRNKSNAYCFFDLTATGSGRDLTAFKRFCAELALAYNMSPRDYDRRMREKQRDNYAQRRAEYVQLAESAPMSSVEQLANRLEAAETAARKAQMVYFAALAKLDKERAAYDSLSSDTLVRRRRFEDEFDRFHHDPKFLKVEREGDTVHVFTRTLYFATKDRKKVFRLGPVRIDILLNPSQKNSPLRIFNLDVLESKNSSLRHHPHVGQCGTPCLGSSSVLMLELVRNLEIFAAASYAVQYAEETNTSDSATWEGQFPLVPTSDLDALRQLHLLPAGV